jgi:hypothetical protein
MLYANNNVTCKHDTESGTSCCTFIWRRKDALQTEVDSLHGIIDYIRTRSEVESQETYRRLRASNDTLGFARSLHAISVTLAAKPSTPRTRKRLRCLRLAVSFYKFSSQVAVAPKEAKARLPLWQNSSRYSTAHDIHPLLSYDLCRPTNELVVEQSTARLV